MKVGDEVEVKVIEVDREGRVRFSRKELLPKPEGYEERPREPRPRWIAIAAATVVDRGGRGGGSGASGVRERPSSSTARPAAARARR